MLALCFVCLVICLRSYMAAHGYCIILNLFKFADKLNCANCTYSVKRTLNHKEAHSIVLLKMGVLLNMYYLHN